MNNSKSGKCKRLIAKEFKSIKKKFKTLKQKKDPNNYACILIEVLI